MRRCSVTVNVSPRMEACAWWRICCRLAGGMRTVVLNGTAVRRTAIDAPTATTPHALAPPRHVAPTRIARRLARKWFAFFKSHVNLAAHFMLSSIHAPSIQLQSITRRGAYMQLLWSTPHSVLAVVWSPASHTLAIHSVVRASPNLQPLGTNRAHALAPAGPRRTALQSSGAGAPRWRVATRDAEAVYCCCYDCGRRILHHMLTTPLSSTRS